MIVTTKCNPSEEFFNILFSEKRSGQKIYDGDAINSNTAIFNKKYILNGPILTKYIEN